MASQIYVFEFHFEPENGIVGVFSWNCVVTAVRIEIRGLSREKARHHIARPFSSRKSHRAGGSRRQECDIGAAFSQADH